MSPQMETIMAATVKELSTGPSLVKVEQGVHIIFRPPEVERDPGPDVLPSPEELDALAAAIGEDAAVTDVVVYKGKPWHMVHGRPRKHPEVHRDFPQTVLKLVIERGEKAVWWSEDHFEITRLEAHGDTDSAAIPPPFPVPPTREEQDGAHRPIHVARSMVPVEGARNHEYKITFKRSGQTIDPNMKCI